MRRLDTGGTLIGAFPEAVFERGTAQLADGEFLVLYSDGVSEAENGAGSEFGEDGIRQAVTPLLGQPPQQVLDALLAGLRDFTRGEGPRDDMTVVVLQYRAQ